MMMTSSGRSSDPRANAGSEPDFPGHCFVDTAYGSASMRNHPGDVQTLEVPADTPDSYVSMFRFSPGLVDHIRTLGSVSGNGEMECYADFVWFDIDQSDLTAALANARQILVNLDAISPALSESAVVYFSGSKGFHLGIPSQLFGLEPSVDLPAKIKRIALAIAKEVSIDTSIYEKNRLWRVPNTINSKSGLYKIPLTYDEFATWSIDQIKEKAKTPHGEARPLLTFEGQYEPIPALVELAASACLPPREEGQRPLTQNGPGWISEALENLSQGNRNTTFAKISGKLSRDGWSEQDIFTLLRPHAERVQFPLAELEGEISGICGRYPHATPFPVFIPIYGENGETESGARRTISLSDLLLKQPGDIDWQVDGIFPSQSIGILGGPPAAGKSWMLMDLAIECARGGRWLGEFQTQRGPVLYVDEESTEALLSRRFRQLLANKGIAENLDIHFLLRQGLCLTEPTSIDLLREHQKLIGPRIVILDSLIRLIDGDENSAVDMARFFRVIGRLVSESGSLFLFADHHRKPVKNDSPETALRGSVDKSAAVDCVLSIKKAHGQIKVTHAKSRYGQELEEFVVRLEEPADGQMRIVFVGDSKSSNDNAALESARRFLTESLSSGQWMARKELVEPAAQSKLQPKHIDRVLQTMLAEGDLQREDRKPTSGRGGKTAFYRLTTPFPDFSLYKEEKRETESSGQGAA
jgi:hypothetical protein